MRVRRSIQFAVVIVALLMLSIPSDGFETPDGTRVGKEYLLRESAKISDIGMEAAREGLLSSFEGNVTEADVVRMIEQAMVNSGSSEQVEAFGVQVASGVDSSFPHGDRSNDETNLILPGEVVVVDLGARYGGYCTDITRTFFMGLPTVEMMEIYNITLEAQLAGIESVSAGSLARDVDKISRDIIEGYGYGDNFTHGLGHGIGLYIHMPPTLYPDSNGILFQSSDMAITIEPGIYLEERWGVRIEDDLMVMRGGGDVITSFPKDLQSIILLPDEGANITEPADMIEPSNAKDPPSITMFIVSATLIATVAVSFFFYIRKRK